VPISLHHGRSKIVDCLYFGSFMPQYVIESVDHEGQGVARSDEGAATGKTVFVEGALAGERVEARITRSKPSYDKAL
jgi:23S rRNA (uracil1939-C5)-methyltransferase